MTKNGITVPQEWSKVAENGLTVPQDRSPMKNSFTVPQKRPYNAGGNGLTVPEERPYRATRTVLQCRNNGFAGPKKRRYSAVGTALQCCTQFDFPYSRKGRLRRCCAALKQAIPSRDSSGSVWPAAAIRCWRRRQDGPWPGPPSAGRMPDAMFARRTTATAPSP